MSMNCLQDQVQLSKSAGGKIAFIKTHTHMQTDGRHVVPLDTLY